MHMSIGFSIKSWDRLDHGDVVLASKKGSEDIIGRVDGKPTADEIFLIERGGMPALLVKADGWEVKIRRL